MRSCLVPEALVVVLLLWQPEQGGAYLPESDDKDGAWLTRAFNEDLALPEMYNKHLRPQHKGPADTVKVGLKIYSIGPISESDMTMQIDMYFRTRWKDERLKSTFDFLVTDNSSNYYINSRREKLKSARLQTENNPAHFNESADQFNASETQDVYMEQMRALEKELQESAREIPELVTLGQEYAEAIWTPDIYFPDSVNIERPGKDLISDSMVLALYHDSFLFQSMRLQMKIRCKLALTLFPMDIQYCDICLESYQYHTGDVKLEWWEGKLEMDKEKMKKYGVANFHIDYDSFVNSTITEDFGFGFNYTTLCVQVRLVRKLSIFLITMYLPSISLVALSWVGFWIDKRAVPARASLTITTILAQITLITGTANQFPGIADLKVADLYLIINFFFVFASLIEFALVSYEPPVKSMAKSWLHSTREKLKTKATPDLTKPSLNEAGFTACPATNTSKLQLDLKKLDKALQGEPAANEKVVGVRKPPNYEQSGMIKPIKDSVNTNGCIATGNPSYLLIANPQTDPLGTPSGRSSPQSLRQAILRREKLFDSKDVIDSADASDTDTLSRNSKLGKKSGGKIDRVLKDTQSLQPKLRFESPSSTSPLLPSSLGNSSPVFARKIGVPKIYSAKAEDDFLEIVDFKSHSNLKKDLYSNSVKTRKPVTIEAKAAKQIGDDLPSLNMQKKPLDAVIKMDKSNLHSTKDHNGKSNKPDKSKKENGEMYPQQGCVCRVLKQFLPCFRPVFEYFQSDQFSKDNADDVSKWLFPATFVLWNVLYFSITLSLAGRLKYMYI